MKHRFSSILLILSLMIALVGVAAAPMAAGTVTLVGVEFVHGKGPVFTFRVSGHFSKADLKGSLSVDGGGNYALHCTQADDTTVKCNAAKSVAGKNVTVYFGGSGFWTHVPQEGPFCYQIWDYWGFTDDQWALMGENCQETDSTNGDIIEYMVPDPNGEFPFPSWFFEDPTVCVDLPNHGPAYYFDVCAIY